MRIQFNNGATLDFWESDAERGRLSITYHRRHQEPLVNVLEPEQLWGLFVSMSDFLDADMVWGQVRGRMTHKLYTLGEVRQRIAEEICAEEGHDLDQQVTRADISGRPIQQIISCDRCHKQFSEMVPGEVSG